jgi:hypothetical protein
MADIAKSREFEVNILLTKDATRDNVLSGIKRAAEELGEGGIFMVSYSGHGGQLPDLDDDEDDSLDETWCLFDGEVVDDELCDHYCLFNPGVRVLLFSDSCHSGSVIKLSYYNTLHSLGAPRAMAAAWVGKPDEIRYRFMPQEAAGRTYRANRKFYDKILAAKYKTKSEVKATVRLISGCQDNQWSMDGPFNGLFTGTLLRVWQNGRFRGDYGRFHREIGRRMPSSQTPNHFVIGAPDPDFDGQVPFTI